MIAYYYGSFVTVWMYGINSCR